MANSAINIPEAVLIDASLDLVVFYEILNVDMREQIEYLANDLDQVCVDNSQLSVLHTGSGFEGLSLPHLNTCGDFSVWNTDADHMVIRKDIEVVERRAKEGTEERQVKRDTRLGKKIIVDEGSCGKEMGNTDVERLEHQKLWMSRENKVDNESDLVNEETLAEKPDDSAQETIKIERQEREREIDAKNFPYEMPQTKTQCLKALNHTKSSSLQCEKGKELPVDAPIYSQVNKVVDFRDDDSEENAKFKEDAIQTSRQRQRSHDPSVSTHCSFPAVIGIKNQNEESTSLEEATVGNWLVGAVKNEPNKADVGLSSSTKNSENTKLLSDNTAKQSRSSEDQVLNQQAVNNKANIENLDNNSRTIENKTMFMQAGQHKGYVFVSSIEFGERAEDSFIKTYCLKNAEFIKNNMQVFPSGRAALMNTKEEMKGPSRSMTHQQGSLFMERDIVYSLALNFWPSQADDWLTRPRKHGWPGDNMIKTISEKGCHIVPVGSHTSPLACYEWRLSFSLAELMLVKSLKQTQKLAYSVLKALIKSKKNEEEDLAIFSSYHLKTALLWLLEKEGTTAWERRTLLENVHHLLHHLRDFYRDGILPNYFIPDNNMIDHHVSKDILKASATLTDLSANIGPSLCRYVETSQALPVFFDQSLSTLYGVNPAKFARLCKYNFLVMALVEILKHQENAKGGRPSESKAASLISKADLLHEASSSDKNANYVATGIPQDRNINEDATVKAMLAKLRDFLVQDQMKVTETSAVLLAVFNVFLALHPTPLDEPRLTENTPELYTYMTQTKFQDCLFWAAKQHEKHCDVIYEFVCRKWPSGPQLHTDDADACAVMKLLLIILGKPTKQASAVTGSLAKRSIEGNRFLLMRMLGTYLLHVHVESAYVAYQASAYLMNASVISELYIVLKYGRDKRLRDRVIDLILAKPELQSTLSEEEFDKLLQMRHEHNDEGST